jgi:hypothetical protein
MSYNFKQHIHNFSVWTAARAVQRAFTKTALIKYAIEDSDLRTFSESSDECDQKSFDEFHKRCAKQIIESFYRNNIVCSYGRASKIIAIYLKTAVIIPLGEKHAKSSVIHTPIDSILLKTLDKKFRLNEFKYIRWTNLDETNYWALINKLKSKSLSISWTLEEFWSPSEE